MSILFIFTVIFILIVSLTIIGVRIWNRNRNLSVLLCAISITLVLFISNFAYDIFYTSTPDSLDIQASQDNQKVNVSLVWKHEYEKYSYGKDYIAISLPKQVRISNTSMKRFETEKEEDSYILEDLRAALEIDPNYNCLKELHLFEVKLQKNFQTTFEITPEISIDNIVIQYIHINYPPMDHFQYWVKTANGVN